MTRCFDVGYLLRCLSIMARIYNKLIGYLSTFLNSTFTVTRRDLDQVKLC